MPTDALIGLLIATLGGAAVGLERQWSGHAEGPAARFAGMRTFTMLGALGGMSGWLWAMGVTAPAAILCTGAVLIIAIGYVVASRKEVEGTTEVAALVVVAAGVLAGLGFIRVSSGIFAGTTLLLVEKSRLHALAQRIDDVGLRSGVRFVAMALVILPLLPEGPYGPFGGVRPRELWALVLFFSGLSFAGYVARRIAGPGHGYLVTGLLGGLISSTNNETGSRGCPGQRAVRADRRRHSGGHARRPGRGAVSSLAVISLRLAARCHRSRWLPWAAGRTPSGARAARRRR